MHAWTPSLLANPADACTVLIGFTTSLACATPSTVSCVASDDVAGTDYDLADLSGTWLAENEFEVTASLACEFLFLSISLLQPFFSSESLSIYFSSFASLSNA